MLKIKAGIIHPRPFKFVEGDTEVHIIKRSPRSWFLVETRTRVRYGADGSCSCYITRTGRFQYYTDALECMKRAAKRILSPARKRDVKAGLLHLTILNVANKPRLEWRAKSAKKIA